MTPCTAAEWVRPAPRRLRSRCWRRSSVYLNNRHYSAETGVFASVDPKVTKTGQPYIYGAANPVTLADPDGLDPDTSARVRYKVENNGGCTYSSRVEMCHQVRSDPPITRAESLVDYSARRRTEPDEWVVPERAGWMTNPYRQRTWRNGVAHVGGYRDDDQSIGGKQVDGGAALVAGVSNVGGEIWDRRRGILQVAGVVAGGVCVAASFGSCLVVAGPVAGANILQSGQDNLTGDDECVGNFAISVVVNAAPFGAGRAAQSLPAAMEQAANVVGGSTMMVGSQVTNIEVCG